MTNEFILEKDLDPVDHFLVLEKNDAGKLELNAIPITTGMLDTPTTRIWWESYTDIMDSFQKSSAFPYIKTDVHSTGTTRYLAQELNEAYLHLQNAYVLNALIDIMQKKGFTIIDKINTLFHKG